MNFSALSTRFLLGATMVVGAAVVFVSGCTSPQEALPLDAQTGVHVFGSPTYANTTLGTVMASVTTARGTIDDLLISHKISAADAKAAEDVCDGIRGQLVLIHANPVQGPDARLLQAANSIAILVTQLVAKESAQ